MMERRICLPALLEFLPVHKKSSQRHIIFTVQLTSSTFTCKTLKRNVNASIMLLVLQTSCLTLLGLLQKVWLCFATLWINLVQFLSRRVKVYHKLVTSLEYWYFTLVDSVLINQICHLLTIHDQNQLYFLYYEVSGYTN